MQSTGAGQCPEWHFRAVQLQPPTRPTVRHQAGLATWQCMASSTPMPEMGPTDCQCTAGSGCHGHNGGGRLTGGPCKNLPFASCPVRPLPAWHSCLCSRAVEGSEPRHGPTSPAPLNVPPWMAARSGRGGVCWGLQTGQHWGGAGAPQTSALTTTLTSHDPFHVGARGKCG